MQPTRFENYHPLFFVQIENSVGSSADFALSEDFCSPDFVYG
jgi:hypothetical protein